MCAVWKLLSKHGCSPARPHMMACAQLVPSHVVAPMRPHSQKGSCCAWKTRLDCCGTQDALLSSMLQTPLTLILPCPCPCPVPSSHAGVRPPSASLAPLLLCGAVCTHAASSLLPGCAAQTINCFRWKVSFSSLHRVVAQIDVLVLTSHAPSVITCQTYGGSSSTFPHKCSPASWGSSFVACSACSAAAQSL